MNAKSLQYLLLLTSTIAGSCVAGNAQELQGDVTVNAGYLPTLRSHVRISPLPDSPKLTLPESSLNMAYESVPTYMQPSLSPMGTAGWRANKLYGRWRGYFELEGGSYLDFNGSAGYRFLDNERATLGVWLQHLSSTAFRPESTTPDTKACPAKRFDESLGLYGSYAIDGIGTADFDLRYHVGYFNYYSEYFPNMESLPKPPTQTLNDLSVRVGLGSAQKEHGLFWRADLSDRYFGYRRFHSAPEDFSPARENRLSLDGNAGYTFNPNIYVNLGLNADYVGYTKAKNVPESWNVLNNPYDPSLSGYGHLALTPSFSFSNEDFTARLGARLDITSPTAKPGQVLVASQDDFGSFHAAPDILLTLRKGRFGLELAATGGVELRTLASTSDIFYYQSPQLTTTLPLYSPVNASLTLHAGSFYGLSAFIGAAYKITDNTTPELLYPLMIAGQQDYSASNFYTMDVKGVSLKAGVGYSYGDAVDIKAAVSYQPQNGTTGFYNGADRPRWIVDTNADINPWSTLHICLGYQYRGVRNLWYATEAATPGNIMGYAATEPHSVRLNDVTDLSLGASYTFKERYTLRFDASNLLDTNSRIAPGMPGEGRRIMGGFAILF